MKALQAKGIQAQMAKVGITVLRSPASVRLLHASTLSIFQTFFYLTRSLFFYYLLLFWRSQRFFLSPCIVINIHDNTGETFDSLWRSQCFGFRKEDPCVIVKV